MKLLVLLLHSVLVARGDEASEALGGLRAQHGGHGTHAGGHGKEKVGHAHVQEETIIIKHPVLTSDNSNSEVLVRPVIIGCPPGQTLNEYTNLCVGVIRVPPDLVCPPKTRLRDGVCLLRQEYTAEKTCPEGLNFDGDKCVASEAVDPEISCGIGEVLVDGRECVLVDTTEPKAACPKGYERSGDRCEQVMITDPELTCPPGFSLRVVRRKGEAGLRGSTAEGVEAVEGDGQEWAGEVWRDDFDSRVEELDYDDEETDYVGLYDYDEAEYFEDDKEIRRLGEVENEEMEGQGRQGGKDRQKGKEKFEAPLPPLPPLPPHPHPVPIPLKTKFECVKDVHVPPIEACPPPSELVDGRLCVIRGDQVPPRKICRSGGRLNLEGQCVTEAAVPPDLVCPPKFIATRGKKCERPRFTHPQLRCPTGYELEEGECVSRRPPEPFCQPDETLTPRGCLSVLEASVEYRCPKGTAAGPDGQCHLHIVHEHDLQLTCPKHYVLIEDHCYRKFVPFDMVCPEGYTPDPRHLTCVQHKVVAPEPYCPIGVLRYNEKGKAICTGSTSTDVVLSCPRGVLQDNVCVIKKITPPKKTCPPLSKEKHGVCVITRFDTPILGCGDGLGHLDHDVCVITSRTSPVQRCKFGFALEVPIEENEAHRECIKETETKPTRTCPLGFNLIGNTCIGKEHQGGDDDLGAIEREIIAEALKKLPKGTRTAAKRLVDKSFEPGLKEEKIVSVKLVSGKQKDKTKTAEKKEVITVPFVEEPIPEHAVGEFDAVVESRGKVARKGKEFK